jgi:hypothetical protein
MSKMALSWAAFLMTEQARSRLLATTARTDSDEMVVWKTGRERGDISYKPTARKVEKKGRSHVAEPVLPEQSLNVGGDARPERLLAGDGRQVSGQVLDHEVSGLPHLVLATFGRKVLCDEIPRRDSGDGDRPLDDGDDDLSDGSGDGDVKDALESGVGVEGDRVGQEDEVVGKLIDELVDLSVEGSLSGGSSSLALVQLHRRHPLSRLGPDASVRLAHRKPLEVLAERRHGRDDRLLDGSVSDNGRRLDLGEVNGERLAKDLDLELEVELELGVLVELDEESDDGHEPRVGWMENLGSRALLEDLADERDGDDEPLGVVALDEEVLEREVLVLDRLVAS